MKHNAVSADALFEEAPHHLKGVAAVWGYLEL